MHTRSRIFLVAAAIALFGALSAVAVASSAHFKKGGEPVCTITGSNPASTTCTASLSGLGGGDLTVNVTVRGFALYECQNHGGNTAAGQNKVLEGPVTAPTIIPADQIKNGNVTINSDPAVLSADPTVSGSAAGCPAANWSGVNPVVTLTSIRMTIVQGGATLFDCSASDPAGLSGKVTLAC